MASISDELQLVGTARQTRAHRLEITEITKLLYSFRSALPN